MVDAEKAQGIFFNPPREERRGIQSLFPSQTVPESVVVEFPPESITETAKKIDQEIIFGTRNTRFEYRVILSTFDEATGTVRLEQQLNTPDVGREVSEHLHGPYNKTPIARLKMTPSGALYLQTTCLRHKGHEEVEEEITIDLRMYYSQFKKLVEAAKTQQQKTLEQ